MVRNDVGDGLAYTVNSYYYTYHGEDEPEQWHKTKNVRVWRRDASGAWKLAVDIWNSDVPPERFSEEWDSSAVRQPLGGVRCPSRG